MRTTHSFENELLTDIIILANTEFLRWDKDLDSEEITEMAKSLIINPKDLVSETKEQCLNQVVQSLKESGLTTGYPHNIAEIRGILSRNHMLNIISNSVEENMGPQNPSIPKNACIYNDLADLAGDHVEMFEKDAYSEEHVAYFNKKLPVYFKNRITSGELYLLYCSCCFISNQIMWRE
tara:strand:+ start:23961 stop:24497 length:537 start_codon:yes stop_codon:yes gene_type:complete